MTLGGLKEGVTPLDMAHAYQTFATGGQLVTGSLGPDKGPVGIREVCRLGRDGDCERRVSRNKPQRKRVLSQGVADESKNILSTVVTSGTANRAQLDRFAAGKTGTTENYGDAWFVGWTPRYTVAVWVGYPDSVQPMEPPAFSFNGEPVAGGTYPAAIWGTFMQQAMDIYARENPEETEELAPDAAATPGVVAAPSTDTGAPVTAEGGDPAPAATAAPAAPAPETPVAPAPETPSTPATAPETAPADPAPAPPDTTGGDDGGATEAPAGGEAAPDG
jgi:penicillin-binding protein 1A